VIPGSGKTRDANVTAGSTGLKSNNAQSEPEVQKLFSFSFKSSFPFPSVLLVFNLVGFLHIDTRSLLTGA
jgi:hypothetical protein